MGFMNTKTASQLVISESAATCIANSMANSAIGRTFLDKKRINKMFESNDLEFDTTSIAQQMPLLGQKIGKDQPLEWELSFRDVKVFFGQFDSDLLLEYTLHYQFFSTRDKKLLISDNVSMITSMNLMSLDDIIYPKILNNKMTSTGRKNIPKNGMKLTQSEYTRYEF